MITFTGMRNYRSYVFKDIAQTQAEVGDIQGALSTAQSIGSEYNRAWVSVTIAEVQAKAGDIQDALSTARTIDNVLIRVSALTAISGAHLHAGIPP